jgi:flavin-dependent dehydrogenase
MTALAFDVVVVGASLSGCTAGVLLARAGASVAIVERHAAPDGHKQLCTHYIQPSALPVLERLGLDRQIEEAGGVRNPIEIWTPSGWVGHHLDAGIDGAPAHGYNIRRVRLDPMVRELAARTPGVTLLTGSPARVLVERAGRVAGVELGGNAGGTTLEARLVVAADGRNSSLARMAGADARSSPNARFGIFAPMRDVDLQRGTTSQMWLSGADAAYVFPNDGGVTVLGWMSDKAMLEACRDRPLEALQDRFRTLPDAPRLHRAQPAGEVLTVKDFPNLWRAPVVRGMAFTGDALMSVDYLWGVGCGWAFQTAAWLADAVCEDLRAGAVPTKGLARYAKRCASLRVHRMLINDFSRRRAMNPVERLMFAAAAKDVAMARHLNRFGARIDGPGAFLSPRAVLRALWVNLRRPQAAPGGTRPMSATPAASAGAAAR